ncbi:sulfite exporter TauE/SafE family protein [Kineosporia sp. A_224]|uniref:sulfite exporter TauE/SafE family protein n=1 Tax=Kineosporia sp. A_224 TaxID=1962180 RepID=UPI000B4BA1F2
MNAVVLFGTGVVAGVVSVVVSLASVISYPALLALGLPPVAANVTNTVALTFTGLGSTLGSRRELVGMRGTVLRLAVMSTLGGATGAALLLLLPGRAFELVAPVLVAGASVVLLVQPRLRDRLRLHPRGMTPWTLAALACAAVYTGYFGAAGGILTLVVLGSVLDAPLVRLNAVKNALAGFANGVAALGFVAFGPVDWGAVVPLAAGFLAGGAVGPAVARRIPDGVLRVVVAGCGVSVAAVLAWRTYR